MRVWQLFVAIGLLLGLIVRPAMAANEPPRFFEVWRSPWGLGHGLTINPTDGSLWACMGDSVFHYDANHNLLNKIELCWPCTPCVDPTDGSCWVVEWGPFDWTTPHPQQVLMQLASDGTVLQQFPAWPWMTPSTITCPDGSFWVYDGLSLARLSSANQELAIAEVGIDLACFTTNPQDGTCWACGHAVGGGPTQLFHCGTDGTILWQGPLPLGVWVPGRNGLAVSKADGSVWAVDSADDDLVHFSEAGVQLSSTPVPDLEPEVTVAPDGSCWAGTTRGTVHVGTDGTVLGSIGTSGALLDPSNGTFWSADWEAEGTEQGGPAGRTEPPPPAPGGRR